MKIDLNCDLGEGFPFDAKLMPLITSANVCCGLHAGDASTSFQTLKLAKQHGVQVGAHPGFVDREHFGRRELPRTEQELIEECSWQIGALQGLAQMAEVSLSYMKPHGALYNMACRDEQYARPLIEIACQFQLPIVGLPGSCLQALCVNRCPFISEGFADRRYLDDGSLVPRSEPNAFIHDPIEAVKQAQWLIESGEIDTLCVHGDNPDALSFVQALRALMLEHEIQIERFFPPNYS